MPKVKSAIGCYGGRSGFGGCESDMGSEGYCGKSRQPECKKSREFVCAYPWKLGRESPNASWDKMHETREVVRVRYISGFIRRALERLGDPMIDRVHHNSELPPPSIRRTS